MTDPTVAFWDEVPLARAQAFFEAFVESHEARLARAERLFSRRWSDLGGAVVSIANLDLVWARWWAEPLADARPASSPSTWYPLVEPSTVTEGLPRWTPFEMTPDLLEFGTALDAWFDEMAVRDLGAVWFLPTVGSPERFSRSLLNRPAIRFGNGKIVESRHILDVVHHAASARRAGRTYSEEGPWHHLIENAGGVPPVSQPDLSLDLSLDDDLYEHEGQRVWQVSFPPETMGDETDVIDSFVAELGELPEIASAERMDREWAEVSITPETSLEEVEDLLAPRWRRHLDRYGF